MNRNAWFWSIIGKLNSIRSQRTVGVTVGEAKRVIEILWNRRYGTGQVQCWPEGSRERGASLSQLIETEQQVRRGFKEIFLRQQDEGCQAKHSEISFKQDNSRLHTTRLVENVFEAEIIQRMKWPASSSDLNPIEYVSDTLGQRIAANHGVMLLSKT
ncbi:hypothetical protein TNCV_2127001 [Trichonephila clavipes]|nr:hypothetical protein TNCV_2127001 [Trichonephila clavipes]